MVENSDLRAFRRALGQFATGVGVVTAHTERGDPIGLTISSFNAVSLNPPLILFSVARDALSLQPLRDAAGFAVNILGYEQRSLSDRFAKSKADKWSSVEFTRGHHDAPLLSGALAHFECSPYAEHDGGDHLIFVARVVRYSSWVGQPLIFFRGAYSSVADKLSAPPWPLPI